MQENKSSRNHEKRGPAGGKKLKPRPPALHMALPHMPHGPRAITLPKTQKNNKEKGTPFPYSKPKRKAPEEQSDESSEGLFFLPVQPTPRAEPAFLPLKVMLPYSHLSVIGAFVSISMMN